MRNPFLIQTARDYDLPYYVVESIYEKDKKNFYQNLEDILTENRNK